MNRYILVLLLSLAVGCSSGRVESVDAQADSVSAPSANEVVLTAAAQKESGVVIERIEPRSLPQILPASGRVTVDETKTWRVGAITEGRVIRVYAEPGTSVSEGQILARMHTHEIHESRALYRQAVAEVARLESAVSYARRSSDRAQRLYKLKAASVAETEQAETELKNTQTALENAQIELQRTRQHLEEFLQISATEPTEHREGMAERDEDLIPVKSPGAGTILARNVTPGTVVSTSGELFVVSDLSSLIMVASVNEEYLARLHVGLPVHVHVLAYPQPFLGHISKLGEQLNPTTRTISVRVELPNTRGLLKPEMYATAEIELGSSEPGFFVPQGAVQEVGGQPSVFVRVSEDRFEVRPVQTGRTLNGDVEIVKGLKSGEPVVTSGSFLLKSQLMKASLGEG